MNVKRIAAVAAGAAMLGAAFAGAVSVDETGLGSYPFFAAGSPQVKIVVGTQAQPSDAVAAANIAAMIGNLAYSSEDITVVGADLLSCTGGAGGSATVSDAKATLEITTPSGTTGATGTYQMKTYIGDSTTAGYLDADIEDDRVTDYNTVSGTVTLSSILDSNSNSYGRAINNLRAGTSLVFKGSVTDPTTGTAYPEDEQYFVYSKVYYSNSATKVQATQPVAAYEAAFTTPLQVCGSYSTTTGTYLETGSCNEAVFMPRHRMKIKFLGSDWVIYGMDSFPTTGGGSDGNTMATAALTLGKSANTNEDIKIGEEITTTNGDKVKLFGVSASGATSANPPLAFEITDKDGNVQTAVASVNVDKVITVGSGSAAKTLILRVHSSFVGSDGTLSAKASVFTDRLVLTNGAQVDTTDNNMYYVRLVGGGTSYGASLKKIQIYRQSSLTDMNPGDKFYFLPKPQLMQLSYDGITTVAYDTLSADSPKTFANLAGLLGAADTTYAVMVSSKLSSAFNFPAQTGALPAVKDHWYYATQATEAGNVTRGTAFALDASSLYQPFYGAGNWGNLTLGSAGGDVVTISGLTTGSVLVYNASGATVTCGALTNATAISSVTGTIATVPAASSWNFTGTMSANGRSFTAVLGGHGGAMNGTAQHMNIVPTSITSNAGTTFSCTGSTGNLAVLFNAASVATVAIGNGISGSGNILTLVNNTVPYSYADRTVNMVLYPAGITPAAAVSAADGYALMIPEYMTYPEAATSVGAWEIDIGFGNGPSVYVAESAGVSYFYYNSTYLYPAAGNGSSYGNTGGALNANYISPRGSVASSVSSSQVVLKYATTLANAMFTFAPSGTTTAVGGGTTTTQAYGANATALDASGYKVVVKSIDATASATGGGAGEVSGADGLAPSVDQAFVVTPLDTSLNPLVVFDSAASDAEALIVVGGPMVNTVAKSVLAGTTLDASTEAMVKVVGDKIVVAGYTAADTTSAANALIAWLGDNKRA